MKVMAYPTAPKRISRLGLTAHTIHYFNGRLYVKPVGRLIMYMVIPAIYLKFLPPGFFSFRRTGVLLVCQAIDILSEPQTGVSYILNFPWRALILRSVEYHSMNLIPTCSIIRSIMTVTIAALLGCNQLFDILKVRSIQDWK